MSMVFKKKQVAVGTLYQMLPVLLLNIVNFHSLKRKKKKKKDLSGLLENNF